MDHRRRTFVVHHHSHSRYHSPPPARLSRARYSRSPPAAFRHSNSSSYPGFRPRGFPPPFRSRPPLHFRSRHLSPPPFRGGFRSRPPPARFSTRARPYRIPYHARPDISPPRPPARSSHSPSRSHSPTRKRSRGESPSPRSLRGLRGGRDSALIGTFGRPMHHPPSYEVSPDRTAEQEEAAGERKKSVTPEDRDELFEQMMGAKKSENLDEYYRLRDKLNAFDLRNPHLAFRGSGRMMKAARKRRMSEEEEEGRGRRRRRRRSSGRGDEDSTDEEQEQLEEVDSVDAHDGEEKNSHKKDEKKRKKSTQSSKKEDKNGSGRDAKRQKSAENNNGPTKESSKKPSADAGPSLLDEELLEAEVGFDLVENEPNQEVISKSLTHPSEEVPIDALHEAEAIGDEEEVDTGGKQQREVEEEAAYNEEEQSYGAMFRPDFVSTLQTALRRGIREGLPKLLKRSKINVSDSDGAKKLLENGTENEQNDQPPTLIELSLSRLVTNTIDRM